MDDEIPLSVLHLQSTSVLWWNSDRSTCELVEGDRFNECLNQLNRDQENRTTASNFSINIVIIKDEPVPPLEKGTRPAGLSITRSHYNGLITAFHLSPSFRKWRTRETGYHDYIKDNHDETLLEHMGWLRRELTDHHPAIMTCPVNLFNLLCRRLDYENEQITSTVSSIFEQQETEMEKTCREVQANNDEKMYKKHRDAIIQLNKLNMAFMSLGCTIDFELSALNFAKGVMDRYKKLYESSNSPNSLPRISDEETQVFNDEIESLRTAARLRQDMRTYAQKKAENMVSLLSAHNLQRDMITSQRISSNARNLTILGSLFITPTFIATLFSTNIFTVYPLTGRIEVAQPLGWVLGASAGGLSGLVTLIMLLAYIWPKVSYRYSRDGCPSSGSNEGATLPAKSEYSI